MSALTQDRKTDQLGTPATVIPSLLAFLVAASTKLYGGAMGAINASGFAVPASANATLKIVGRVEKQVDNSSGSNGDLKANIHPGYFFFDNGAGVDAIARANIGSYCYASDDHTVNLTDAGGTRPLAGIIVGLSQDYGLPSGQVLVAVGFASPYLQNPELAGGSSMRARAVATSLAAYTATAGVITANANGAIGAQDGVTLVAGDLLFVPAGVAAAAKDAGLYVVTAVGGASAKYVLTRSDAMPTGSTQKTGIVFNIGGEGTTYKNTSWRSMLAADPFVVDTDDGKFYPVEISFTATLVAGQATINAPIFSAKSFVGITRKVANTSTATTGGYHPTNNGADGITPGVIGTGAVIVEATAAAGTTNANDVSTLHVTIRNQAA